MAGLGHHIVRYLILSAVGLYVGSSLYFNPNGLQQLATSLLVPWVTTNPTYALYAFIGILFSFAYFLGWFVEHDIRGDERRRMRHLQEARR